MANATITTEKKTRAPRKAKTPLTTRENLSSLIGTARKILRKDKGLNGDVDRLPLLTWVMFLKFLDDLEIVHEELLVHMFRFPRVVTHSGRSDQQSTASQFLEGLQQTVSLEIVGQAEHGSHRGKVCSLLMLSSK